MHLPNTLTQVIQTVQKRYEYVTEDRLSTEAFRISALGKNVRDLIGKRILDVGCGAIHDADTPPTIIPRWLRKNVPVKQWQFNPWYCRLLYELGAVPVGVDVASNKYESFESHQVDLLQKDALKFLPDESIDFANNSFFTCPNESRYFPYSVSPAVLRNLTPESDAMSAYIDPYTLRRIDTVHQNIQQQVSRVLKEGGMYTQAEFLLQKQAGKLVNLGVHPHLF